MGPKVLNTLAEMNRQLVATYFKVVKSIFAV